MTAFQALMFIQKIEKAQNKNNSLVCLGLDPQIEKIQTLGLSLDEWLISMVEATADLVCAYKPQFAHFSALRAESALNDIIKYIHQNHPDIPVILDAKRGDIGSTAEYYAKEAFERYRADALTVNPYLGGDSLEPYLKYHNKGVIALCKTSNTGSGDLQNLPLVNGLKVYEHVAQLASVEWNQSRNMLLVVGATYPQELKEIREIVGNMPLLVPGVGAQGGDLTAILKNGLREDRLGLIISSSRSILYAGSQSVNYQQATREACQQLKDSINVYR